MVSFDAEIEARSDLCKSFVSFFRSSGPGSHYIA